MRYRIREKYDCEKVKVCRAVFVVVMNDVLIKMFIETQWRRFESQNLERKKWFAYANLIPFFLSLS